MESIFDELDKKEIAPQNFSGAIRLCILIIILSYLDAIIKENARFLILNLILGPLIIFFSIYILFVFKKYLGNFKFGKAVYWVKWHIAINIASLILLVVSYFILVNLHQIVSPVFGKIMVFLLLISFSSDVFVMIRVGLELQKIANDFIGLLYQLGTMLIYLMPVAFIWNITIGFSGYFRNMLGGPKSLPDLIGATFDIIPTVLTMVIFYRAMKYRRQQKIILGSQNGDDAREQ